MKARTATAAVLVLALAAGLAVLVIVGSPPEDALPPDRPPAPPPPGDAPPESPVHGLWAIYARTPAGASFLNVTLLGLDAAEAHVGFTLVDAAGEPTTWVEVIDRESRDVVSTTNPLAGTGALAYDTARGAPTWLFIPADADVGDTVRILHRELVLEPGEAHSPDLAGTLAACFEAGCYVFDAETGLYVHWVSDEEPGWTFEESASAWLNERYGAHAAAPDA